MITTQKELSNDQLEWLYAMDQNPDAYFLIHLTTSNMIKTVKIIDNDQERSINAKEFNKLFHSFQFMPYSKNDIKYLEDSTKEYKARPVTLRLQEILAGDNE